MKIIRHVCCGFAERRGFSVIFVGKNARCAFFPKRIVTIRNSFVWFTMMVGRWQMDSYAL
jgi:hypothetical protein